MDPYLLLVVVLLLYALAAAGPSLLGRERLAWGQVAEILLWGIVLLAVAWLARIASPLLYLLVLYLLTMRVRLVVEVANALAARRQPGAQPLYALAGALALNPMDRAIVRVNQGAALLHNGQVAQATGVLEGTLRGGRLGNRLGAACRCNLGLAYLRAGDRERGRALLRETVDLLPGSVYARRASIALRRLDAAPAEAQ
jgi:tetratricopeptide (TPR) repeat protein